MSNKKSLIIVSAFLIIIGILGRLLPHIPNVSPITAIALFSTAYLSLRYSFVVFLLTMVMTDIFIGFYSWPIMLSVYGSFALAGLIGLYIKKNKTPAVIFGSTIISSAIFFIVTNWAVWQFGAMYTHSFSGLMESYTMAIPFFKNSLIGDIFYTGVFFGVFEAVQYVVTNGIKKSRLGVKQTTL